MSLSLFNFWWTGVKNGNANPNDWFADTSLRIPHQVFNDAFVYAFPRNLYTEPFTSYTDASNFGIGSQLTGTAETVGDIVGVKNWILQEAQIAGITGNPANLRVSLRSLEQIQQGQNLELPPSTVNPLVTTDGFNAALQAQIDNIKGSLPDASILGFSTGTVLLVGAGLLIFLTMRSPQVRILRGR